ncbi:MAG: hypothetical protein ACLSFT_06865 [Ruminococcus callidus]
MTGATPLASGDAGLLDLFLGNVGGSLVKPRHWLCSSAACSCWCWG